MTIPPIAAANTAAILAGTDRAAASETAKGSVDSSGVTGDGKRVVEKTEQVIRGDAAGDPGADGRQLLDTFERQNREETEKEETGEKTTPSVSVVTPTTNDPNQANHLDFQA